MAALSLELTLAACAFEDPSLAHMLIPGLRRPVLDDGSEAFAQIELTTYCLLLKAFISVILFHHNCRGSGNRCRVKDAKATVDV